MHQETLTLTQHQVKYLMLIIIMCELPDFEDWR